MGDCDSSVIWLCLLCRLQPTADLSVSGDSKEPVFPKAPRAIWRSGGLELLGGRLVSLRPWGKSWDLDPASSARALCCAPCNAPSPACSPRGFLVRSSVLFRESFCLNDLGRLCLRGDTSISQIAINTLGSGDE